MIGDPTLARFFEEPGEIDFEVSRRDYGSCQSVGDVEVIIDWRAQKLIANVEAHDSDTEMDYCGGRGGHGESTVEQN